MKLYRGLSYINNNNILENKFLKEPRVPLHTNINIHNVADNWFYNKFGVRARSETIFCTTDLHQALRFGYVHKIVPIEDEGIRFIYSPNVIDLIDIQEDIEERSEGCYDEKEIVEWLESKYYCIEKSFKDIPSGFKGEIMLYCKKYEIKEL
ncbi:MULTISPECIES: hypothetical protein [unclassified Psychrobacter]|uniref:hypothetical protein n=1 Tax=unclassified Psychrobacter TaxID=196806 RepID=UPI003316B3FF